MGDGLVELSALPARTLAEVVVGHGYCARCSPRRGSIVSRCCAKRSSVARHTPSESPAPTPNRRRTPSDDEGQDATAWARPPGQRDAQPDLRQVRVAVGHRLRPHLHQTDHRHQHPQIPEPADQHDGPPPSPCQHGDGNGRQRQEGGDGFPERQARTRVRIEHRQSRRIEELAQIGHVGNQGVGNPCR